MRGMLKASSSDNAPGTARLFGKEEGSEGSEGRRVSIDLKRVEWLVIDEADVLLGTSREYLSHFNFLTHITGPDFAEETLTTLSHFLDTVNILLVTATLPPSLIHHTANSPPLSAHQWTRVLSPGMHRLPSRLSTRFVSSTGGNLPSEVVKELKKAFAEDELAPAQAIRRREGVNQPFGDEGKTKAVVFCNSDSRVTNIAKVMREKGLECLPWTGEGEQRIRGKNGELDAFLKPTRPNVQTTPGSQTASVGVLGTSVAPRVLVTTSLLSRGLDFDPSVSTVILVDPPRDALDFVHRAGRAGRAGRSGRVIVFGMGDGRDLSGRGKVGKGVKGVVRPRVGSGSWSVEGRSGSGRTGPETRVPKAGMRR
jgi:ATP-dependent RNA helicase MRH4